MRLLRWTQCDSLTVDQSDIHTAYSLEDHGIDNTQEHLLLLEVQEVRRILK